MGDARCCSRGGDVDVEKGRWEEDGFVIAMCLGGDGDTDDIGAGRLGGNNVDVAACCWDDSFVDAGTGRREDDGVEVTVCCCDDGDASAGTGRWGCGGDNNVAVCSWEGSGVCHCTP